MHYFFEEVLLGCLSLTDDGLDSRVRGLLPDPNPRVPKYCRVSGRVSG